MNTVALREALGFEQEFKEEKQRYGLYLEA